MERTLRPLSSIIKANYEIAYSSCACPGKNSGAFVFALIFCGFYPELVEGFSIKACPDSSGGKRKASFWILILIQKFIDIYQFHNNRDSYFRTRHH